MIESFNKNILLFAGVVPLCGLPTTAGTNDVALATKVAGFGDRFSRNSGLTLVLVISAIALAILTVAALLENR